MQKKKYIIHNTKYLILAFFKKREGQSLIEVLIGLTIGALLIGTAAIGVAFMLRSTAANDNLQMASGMVQASLDKARAFAGANWQNIYRLTKGTSTTYFLNSSSTEFFLVEGKEGVVGTDVMDGLVGRWGLDEATGTVAYDMSGNNNNGTLMNNVARATSTCKVGYCCDFDATDDYVTITDGSSLDFGTGDFSVSGWLYINSSRVTATKEYGFINKNGTFQNSSGWGIELSSWGKSTPFPTLNISGYNTGQTSWCNTCATKNDGITTNAWHQVSLVRTGSYLYLYIDGVLSGSNNHAQVSVSVDNSQPILIGDNSWGPNFPGMIDDVRVYNRALSADEIKRMYESAVFSRYFTVENVCRTNDASSTVSGVTPCGSGSFEDPSTQKVSSVVEWIASTGATNLTLVDYITRWKNAIFQQTDWSGGSGDDAIYTEPGSGYSSSTNVDGGSESIRIHGI
jgi:hypothetical protein